jgi:hypothetical protein
MNYTHMLPHDVAKNIGKRGPPMRSYELRTGSGDFAEGLINSLRPCLE